MTKSEFVREHKRLIKILRLGNRRLLDKEASVQSKELSAFIKKNKKNAK